MARELALVTGATAGIGAAYADRLAARGVDLILTGRDEARLQATAERLSREAGVSVDVLRADLTTREGRALVEDRLGEDDRISMLINNAGMADFKRIVEADPDNVEQMLQLNVIAVTRLAQAAAKAFVSRGRGTIVIVSSSVAISPTYRNSTYGATKTLGLYLAVSMHHELEGTGVRMQAVLPGMTRTEIWDRSGRGAASLPEGVVMDAHELVDAALAGLEQGELVTIPALQDIELLRSYEMARDRLNKLSSAHPASRYGVTPA